MWTKLDTDAYSSNDQNLRARAGTVAQGMEKTGGYIGTDLDNNEQKKHQLHMQTNQQAAKQLQSFKLERRHLREKILCAYNCQFEKWSFMTGLTLAENCPVDCPVNQLSGQLKYKTSRTALEAYNSYFDIRDFEKNKASLHQIDLKIEQHEKQFKRIEQKSQQEKKMVLAKKKHMLAVQQERQA